MEATLAAVFSAALMFAPQGAPSPAAPDAKPVQVAAAQQCWGHYVDCYICDTSPYITVCDYYCYTCPGFEEPVCEPTGWQCRGGSGQDWSSGSKAQFTFAPSGAGRRLSCS